MATFTGTVTDARGQTATASGTITTTGGTTFPDGSSGAPFGTPQIPALLSSYVSTPAWKVAGVDYHTGYPSNITLKNPSTISMSGVTVFANDSVEINGNNITLDGYDFKAGTKGYQIYINGNNAVISNSRLGFPVIRDIGSLAIVEANAAISGLTISKCEIDGSNTGSNDSHVVLMRGGAKDLTIEYCYVHDIGNDFVDVRGGGKVYLRYNLIKEVACRGSGHGDVTQYIGTSGMIWDVQYYYNTLVQHQQVNQSNGCYIESGGGDRFPNPQLHHNTGVTYTSGPGHGGTSGNPGGWAYSFIFRITTIGQTVTTGSLDHNYCDAAGCINWRVTSNFPSSMAITGNINMINGSVLM